MKPSFSKSQQPKYKQRGSTIVFVVLAIIVLSLAAGFYFFEPKQPPSYKPQPTRLSSTNTQPVATQTAHTQLPEVTVYKSETCGCCNKWITHLENEGFKVVSHNVNDLNMIKEQSGVLPGLASCHTALIGNYVIEGHVPAADIKRLLTEKPDVIGLTAPGMPQASPGMQPEGLEPSGYDVIAFDKQGNTTVYNRY